MAEFRWFGHNCVRIRAKEATVMCDPVGGSTGYRLPKQTADVVTISHEHPGHTNLEAITSEFQVLRGPGEYEVHDVFVTGIRTYHDDKKGAQHGYNTIYLIEIEGLVVCHLGDLGHTLTVEQAEALANVDILFVPVGGGDMLDPAKAAEVVGQIEPKLVIPMQYATDQGDKHLKPLAPFCKELGIEIPVAEEKLVIRGGDLGETMRVVSLAVTER